MYGSVEIFRDQRSGISRDVLQLATITIYWETQPLLRYKASLFSLKAS